jgi:hypothetical protein
MGAQYYSGLSYAKPNDNVSILPDPFGKTMKVKHNDPNALAVVDAKGRQLGYLPKSWSSLFAPYVQSKQLVINGTIQFMGGSTNTVIKYIVKESSNDF